ncbi:MAG: Bcr/CflA subfamily drug resistance transporter [Alphaproteobacteria bacterium]|nr:Bcr/CflA subfamily drug resistance transporter [Alphaproteobacteria bacterium]
MNKPETLHPPLQDDAVPMRPGFREFVALIAGLMALNALAIDAMVPALPAIGRALHILTENERQLVVSFYMFGFGTTQILYGPLSDRYGRKPVLIVSLVLYVGFALACAAAGSFTLLLVARLLQGAAAASSRVLTISIVRDRFEGARMARLMSLAFMVFLLMPVLAPSFGQLTLLVASWRAIFFGLAGFAALMLIWSLARLPETLHPEYRRPFSLPAIFAAARETLTNRQSLGYTLAFTLLMGALMGYILSIQQIVFDVFRRPELIAITFAGIAGPMAITSYANSRLVERLGTRRIAHFGLSAFTLVAFVHFLCAMGGESLGLFIALQAATMACFGLSSANFGALAMQPMGHVAGTASSVQGTIGTILGALLGLAIGQSFNGSVLPMVGGDVLFGAAALLILLVTERGRLFGAA